jgi:hypothetical protein
MVEVTELKIMKKRSLSSPLNFMNLLLASKVDKGDRHTDRKVISQVYFLSFRKENKLKFKTVCAHIDTSTVFLQKQGT